jgi:hypothetical protein
MRRNLLFLRPVRAAVVVAVLAGYSGLAGCSQDWAESAPKLKGNKDEIQKALQSGGAKPNAKTKVRRKA